MRNLESVRMTMKKSVGTAIKKHGSEFMNNYDGMKERKKDKNKIYTFQDKRKENLDEIRTIEDASATHLYFDYNSKLNSNY